MLISVRISDGSWLNTSARLPGPRPTPTSAIVGAFVSIIIVGIGAALVARQIGRPLSDLAGAARVLGAGQTNVSAPVSGPEDVRRASTAFNVMAERLGRQLNRQRQMLWALSHDLRTPITAIRLRAELIEDESERQRLLASVAEMETLPEQALALARAGASEEARINVDLADRTHALLGSARFYPDIMAQIEALVPPEMPVSDYYAQLLFSGDVEKERQATRLLGAYESVIGALTPALPDNADDQVQAFKIYTHYAQNAFFIDENQLLANAHKIVHLPTLILHNRLDLVCPLEQAYALFQHMHNATLEIVPSLGHGSPELDARTRALADAFVRQHA